MENDKDIIICQCNNSEHQMLFLYSEDDGYPMVFVHIHLNKQPFIKRIKNAIKYIFGYQSKFGMFDEFIINPEDIGKLQKILLYLSNEKTL